MNRAVMAARAKAANRPKRTPGASPSTNPAMRTSTPVAHCAGPVRRSRASKMTGAQRNSEGRRSEWNMTPYVFTDPKWGATCSTV